MLIYVDRFGELKDDFALVAEVEKKVVGAVWVRIMNDYGHIDDKTPSLAISLYKEYRGQGIGTDMMKEMLSLLKAHGYKRVSLSVQKTNYAVEMYRKIGFDIVRGNEAFSLYSGRTLWRANIDILYKRIHNTISAVLSI